MKPILFGSIPIIGILLFYYFGSSSERTGVFGNNSTIKQGAPPVVADSSNSLTKSKEDLESEQIRKLNNGLSKSADFLTPEMQRKMVDARMHARASSYDALFKLWELDTNTTDQILQLIRQRETALIGLRKQFFKSGLGNASEYEAEKATEEILVERHLVSILGQDRFDVLIQQETSMHANSLSQAMRNLAD